MNFCQLVLVFILTLSNGNGEGIFSKIMNYGRSENNQGNNFVDVCETVRVMPRIAMAVVGGSPVRLENSAPYVAAVGQTISNGSTSWFCGGSLISSHDILTAAHCLVSRNVSTIRVGSLSTKKRSSENDYEVLNIVIHPEYKITESYNDIGIIKVKSPITFDSNIKPICLPQDNNNKYEKERPKVIGWGAEEFGGEGSQKLQQVEVEVFSNSNCEKAYRNSTIAPKNFPRGITNEQLCAGSKIGGKDACQGDSGGPLVLTDELGIVRLIGIVSTGAGCGFKKYPGVYTRVSSYVDWINQQVQNSESHQKNPREKNSFSSRPNEPSNKFQPKGTYMSTQSSSNTNKKTLNTSQNTNKTQRLTQTSRETNLDNNNNNNIFDTKVGLNDSSDLKSLSNSPSGKRKTSHDSQEFIPRGRENRKKFDEHGNERTSTPSNQHYRTGQL